MATLRTIVHAKAIEIGKLAVRSTTSAGTGHPTSALSLAHLTTMLMYRAMRWNPKDPGHPGSDRLVLSEGHAVPIIYAACADLGVTFGPDRRAMTIEDLATLRDIDSLLDGHPNPALGFPFFDAATGSLGQGLSVAAGLGCAAKADGIGKTIYCLIGDGESREGQIWEAMDFIRDQGLTNVVAIFNCNGLGQSDYVSSAQDWTALISKVTAFGWQAVAIDGHDPDQVEGALAHHKALAAGDGRPLAIVARTVKGWGVPSLTGPGHHGTAVKPEDLAGVIEALDTAAKELGADSVSADEIAATLKIAPPPEVEPPAKPSAAAGFSRAAGSDAKKISPRRAYGWALHALGEADQRVVALDGDVKNSTYAQDFAKAFPERYFEARIAEQNMISAAAGLAAAGKLAFASSFGRFLERGFDQLEMALISGLPIKLCGSHVGVTLAADGPSQMALADIAFARTLAHTGRDGKPALQVVTPSDAVSAYALTMAMAEHPGACYLRAVRGDLPLLYKPETHFPLGGFKVLRQGKPGARLLVAAGYMVHSCLAAADRLGDVTVVDAYALPLDTEGLLSLAAGAPILTVEDNYVGGLASELAEAAAGSNVHRINSLVVRDIPKSGRTADDLLAYVHLSVDDIVQAAERLGERKQAAE